MAVLFLAFAPVIGACAFLQSKEIKPRFSLIREQFSRLNTVCQENISGNRVVKAFTQEDFEINKFTTENQAFWQRNVDSSHVWAKYLPILEICAGLLGFILLLAGGILVILGKMELWQMITINGYLWAINNPMRMLGWLMNDTQRFVASLEKVFDLMRQKIYIKNPEDAVNPGKIKGGVEFKSVWFNYDRNNLGEPALKNISFKIEPGKTLGIVGATGSGKTTLINLIGRYYDVTSGEILVDGINVKKYELFGLRRNVAIASQDVFLFSDTVEGNIVYGVPDAPMETVFRVATIADADGFIKEMEDGYDTIIGERGVGLSGGQKQRLSLARAVAVNPSILILDDTTSAVDMETEHSIQAALKETKQNNPGMSIFIIAHRISSVKSADLILVLDKGEIIERGTHDELVGLEGYYYNLFMNQYGDYKKEAE
ncbi:atp-binding cassette sub-family b [Holotrichia oblita]|nr:atp-binding cassette sub-family b [Holotrichia oblita]